MPLLLLLLLFSIAVAVQKVKREGNCSEVECPWSSQCVNGRCERLQRLMCNWETKCPAELPVCWRNQCAATKTTFLTCENVGKIDLVSFEPLAVGRHKAAFAGAYGGAGVGALPVVVKSVVEPTSRRRQMFLRSAIEELDVLTDLGHAAQEFVPKYYGGCLRGDQFMPLTVHEHLPICFDTLLQLNVPWCTRLAIAIRIFKLVAYFSRTRLGPAVLCDFKIEQICFDAMLNPKLVDLNQVQLNVTDDRPFNGGTKCGVAASSKKETAAAGDVDDDADVVDVDVVGIAANKSVNKFISGHDDDVIAVVDNNNNNNNNKVDDKRDKESRKSSRRDGKNKNNDNERNNKDNNNDNTNNNDNNDDDIDRRRRAPSSASATTSCLTKCFTSFHRDHPQLRMNEELCGDDDRCPGD